MLTRISFPVLTVTVTGYLFLACGSPDRIFVDTDGGAPPVDSSPGTDTRIDTPPAVDQQSDSLVDVPAMADGTLPETSTDARIDAASDSSLDARVDGGTPDMGPNDTVVISDTGANDAPVNDLAVNDVAVNDVAVNDVAVNDTALDVGSLDGGFSDGGIIDVNGDIIDCSSTPTPRISPSGSTGYCPGVPVMLTSTSATSYLWSNAATTQSIYVGAAGSYTVTTTDARGCMATSVPTVVNAYPSPTATITAGGPTRFCNGGSVSLTASPASSYLWSTGQTAQSILVSSSGSYSVTTTDANGCSATSAATAVTVVVPATGARSYTFTGAPDTFVVPECVKQVTVDAYGAQGGNSNSSSAMALGGYGGEVYAYLNVTPGSVLQIRVGGAGVLCTADNAGGWNGGGNANCTGTSSIYSATGGGATDIRVTPYGLDDRVIVAGGGGGAGYNCNSNQDSGGVGGGQIGGTFPTTCGNEPNSSGRGGTQASGGIGGTYPSFGNAGSGAYGLGGSGVSTGGSITALEGGGGGGGYFGGGGGCWVGGGGGSDYLRSTVVTPIGAGSYPGVRTGPGVLFLSW